MTLVVASLGAVLRASGRRWSSLGYGPEFCLEVHAVGVRRFHDYHYWKVLAYVVESEGTAENSHMEGAPSS
ncbi:hypothetical protein LA080_007571 [Diaporthe eres]|nr:hypothetical protein LA080_007571 [Diaporthe eres]